MGTEDYSKLKKTFEKKMKSLKKANLTVKKEGEKAAIQLRTHRTILKDGIKELQTIDKRAGQLVSEWIDRADEIIPLQEELAKAKKAKDASRMNELKKEILLIHKTAQSIGQQWTALQKRTDALRKIVVPNHTALKKLSS